MDSEPRAEGALERKIRSAPFERPPVRVTSGGVSYVETRDLVRSAAFWRAVRAMRRVRTTQEERP